MVVIPWGCHKADWFKVQLQNAQGGREESGQDLRHILGLQKAELNIFAKALLSQF